MMAAECANGSDSPKWAIVPSSAQENALAAKKKEKSHGKDTSAAQKAKKKHEKGSKVDERGANNIALFVCDLCGKEFSTFGSWSGHRSMHSKELAERRESATGVGSPAPKRDSFFCLVCEKLCFETASTLIIHLREKHNWAAKKSPEATGKKKANPGKGTPLTDKKSAHTTKACETVLLIKQEPDAIPGEACALNEAYALSNVKQACTSENGSNYRGGKAHEARCDGKPGLNADKSPRTRLNGELENLETKGPRERSDTTALGQLLPVVVQQTKGTEAIKLTVAARQNKQGKQKKKYETTAEYPGIYLCDICRKKFNRFSAWNGHRSKHSREIAKRKEMEAKMSSEGGDGQPKRPKKQVWLFSCSNCNTRFTAANLLHAHTETCGRPITRGDSTPRDRVNGRRGKNATTKAHSCGKLNNVGVVIRDTPSQEAAALGQGGWDDDKCEVDEDSVTRNWQLVPYVSQVPGETSMAGDLVRPSDTVVKPCEDAPGWRWKNTPDGRQETDGVTGRGGNHPDRTMRNKSGTDADVKRQSEGSPYMDSRKRRGGGFVCPICIDVFSTAAELGEHVTSHPVGTWSCTFSPPKKCRNGGTGKAFLCPICEETFASEQGLAGHGELYHNIAVKQRMDEFMRRNSCGKCELNSGGIEEEDNGHRTDCTGNNQDLGSDAVKEEGVQVPSHGAAAAAEPCKVARGYASNGLGNGEACTLTNGQCNSSPSRRKNTNGAESTRVWWKTGEVVLQDNRDCVVCEKKVDSSSTVLCDLCDQKFHLSCLDPPLLSVPDSDWCCPVCTV